MSLSSEVDPAYREYERTAVTAFDAYVKPVLDRYLVNLERLLERRKVECGLQVMMSRGGICSSPVASERPVGLLLSGPAAGVIGSRVVGRGVGVGDLISVDIGGTSCDIALVEDGEPVIRPRGRSVSTRCECPWSTSTPSVRAAAPSPGSTASGGLRVGPHSAGSEPGPACYAGGGVEATVTDASVVLGYLNPERFAGGGMTLDPALAHEAIDSRIARPLGLSCEEAALGIHRVLNAQMGEGIRLVSIRRGHDPRRFSMLALAAAARCMPVRLPPSSTWKRCWCPLTLGCFRPGGCCAPRLNMRWRAPFIVRSKWGWRAACVRRSPTSMPGEHVDGARGGRRARNRSVALRRRLLRRPGLPSRNSLEPRRRRAARCFV